MKTFRIVGEVREQQVTWRFEGPERIVDRVNMTFTGTLDEAGTTISGRYRTEMPDGNQGDFRMTKRQRPREAGCSRLVTAVLVM